MRWTHLNPHSPDDVFKRRYFRADQKAQSRSVRGGKMLAEPGPVPSQRRKIVDVQASTVRKLNRRPTVIHRVPIANPTENKPIGNEGYAKKADGAGVLVFAHRVPQHF